MTHAWLYWDPNRYIFILPYFNHPITWYSILFALGFLIGYLLFFNMIKSTLRQNSYVSERDICSWPRLLKFFHEGPHVDIAEQKPLFSYFSEKTKIHLKKIEEEKALTEEDKNQIIDCLNDAITDEDNAISRSTISSILPKAVFSISDLAYFLTDRLFWLVFLGTVIGARLGHVFFYDWARYQSNPIEILKVWEGGLASHGGAIGIIFALLIYIFSIRKRFPEIKFLLLLDHIVVPVALAGVLIRLGNFINQEIVGTETDLPWAVLFAHPYSGKAAVLRHPVQLYEAAAYLFTFFLLGWLWIKKREVLKTGYLTGLFFLLIFSSRFFLEFFKADQGGLVQESFLQTGQVLSIPLILVGLWLMYRPQASVHKR